jgi:hypothetical protein
MAENAKAEAGVRAMAQAHGVSAAAAARHVAAIQQIGFEYTEAAQAVKRFLVADLDLSKAEGLAKLAKDVAAIQNVAAGEALETIVMAIESGHSSASRSLRHLGLFINFEREALAQQLRLGRALTEAEEKQVRYNAVVREGAKIQGAHAAVLGTAQGQLGALKREFQNLREEIGARFESDLVALLNHLRQLVGWLRDNADGLVKLAQAVAAVGAAFATYKLADKILALAKSIAALNLAALNPYALLGVAAVAAGAAVYSQWKRGQEEVEARFSDLERRALRMQLLAGKVSLGELRRRGMTDDQLRELVAGRRVLPGEQSFEIPTRCLPRPATTLSASFKSSSARSRRRPPRRRSSALGRSMSSGWPLRPSFISAGSITRRMPRAGRWSIPSRSTASSSSGPAGCATPNCARPKPPMRRRSSRSWPSSSARLRSRSSTSSASTRSSSGCLTSRPRAWSWKRKPICAGWASVPTRSRRGSQN